MWNGWKPVHTDCEGSFDRSVGAFLKSYLEVATLIQGVWGAKDSHLPVIEVRLSHQSDAKAFQRLLLQGFQLHHQGLLGTWGCLVGHVNPTSDTGRKVK